MIKEAVLLNLIDDLDAKMAMLDKAYTNKQVNLQVVYSFDFALL